MRRVLPILAMAALTTALFTSPVLARANGARTGTCTIDPLSAPSGSTFTAHCSGWASGEAITFGWKVGGFQAGGSLTADSSGNFTVSQTIPQPYYAISEFSARGPQNWKRVPKDGFVEFRTTFYVTEV